jgi:hypothetical protein
MGHKQISICFLCIEAALYACFLTLDLFGLSGPDTALKYAGVLLCLLFSLSCAAQGGDRLVPPALLLTALADYFLLVSNSHYALGVVIFLFAQSVYLIRLRLAAGKSYLPLRAGLPLLAALMLYRLGLASPLNLLALLYFSQLLTNTVLAWTLPGWRWKTFSAGLTLFVCCDLCVGAYNSASLVPAPVWSFAAVGMWLFYLPSQVLIALSALPMKGASHETR